MGPEGKKVVCPYCGYRMPIYCLLYTSSGTKAQVELNAGYRVTNPDLALVRKVSV